MEPSRQIGDQDHSSYTIALESKNRPPRILTATWAEPCWRTGPEKTYLAEQWIINKSVRSMAERRLFADDSIVHSPLFQWFRIVFQAPYILRAFSNTYKLAQTTLQKRVAPPTSQNKPGNSQTTSPSKKTIHSWLTSKKSSTEWTNIFVEFPSLPLKAETNRNHQIRLNPINIIKSQTATIKFIKAWLKPKPKKTHKFPWNRISNHHFLVAISTQFHVVSSPVAASKSSLKK